MKPMIITIDETIYLSPSAVETVGKLYTKYMFDADVETYCGELTPSFYLIPFGIETENQIDEELYDELTFDLQSHYLHCRSCGSAVPLEGDFESMEDALEYASRNR